MDFSPTVAREHVAAFLANSHGNVAVKTGREDYMALRRWVGCLRELDELRDGPVAPWPTTRCRN